MHRRHPLGLGALVADRLHPAGQSWIIEFLGRIPGAVGERTLHDVLAGASGATERLRQLVLGFLWDIFATGVSAHRWAEVGGPVEAQQLRRQFRCS